MKNLKYLFLITLFSLSFGSTFSQTTDSLSVYPNPFNISATIYFEIAQSDTITLKLFTMTGQPVRTYFESTVLPSGSYNISLLGDSLSKGVYLVVLKIGSTKNITQKVIKSDYAASTAVHKSEGQVQLYPNPTKDQITIPIAGNKTILITDLNGKTVKSFTTDQKVISLIDLVAGQYMITIITNQDEIISREKILKME